MTRLLRYMTLAWLGLTVGLGAVAQKRTVMNKPYIDTRRWHYGFNIGIHDQALPLVNNGYIDPETGAQWMADCDQMNLGFTVGVLGSLRINRWLDMRINPGLNFGSKHIRFLNLTTGETETQDMRSTYIALPVDFRFNAPRYNNFRPYVMLGVSGQYDLTASKHTKLRCKPMQAYLEVGMGCDLYLPFFKLIPELKFSLGLGDILSHDRSDLTDVTQFIYTQSVDRATSNMVTLNLYFE